MEFEARCRKNLGLRPRTLNLSTNYRSPPTIVDFYSEFIQQIDWRKGPGREGAYRVEKEIVAHRKDAAWRSWQVRRASGRRVRRSGRIWFDGSWTSRR